MAHSSLIIRSATPDDYERVLDIYNRLHHDSPPTSREDYEGWISGRPEGAGLEQWVAEQDGLVVGALDLSQIWMAADAGAWQAFLEVDDLWRGRGIGRRLYDHIASRIVDLGIRRLYGEVREDVPEALAFAQRRGFERTGRVDRFSRLTVAAARLDAFEDDEARLAREGIRITTLAELGMDDEAFLRALHRMSEATMHDVPHSEPFEERPFEFWLEHMLRFPGNAPERTWIALDGERPVGIARLRERGPAIMGNAYTGVDREYRGRGIARALKVRTVRWAQENGVRYIYTGNDVENRRMLDINMRLGYQQLPGTLEVMKVFAPGET